MTILDLVGSIRIEGEGFPVLVRTEAQAGWSSGWCAQVLDSDSSAFTGLRLEFLRPEHKEVDARGGSRKSYRILAPGVYQAESINPSHQPYRVFFSVGSDGSVEVLGTTTETHLRALEERAMDRLVAMKLLQEI